MSHAAIAIGVRDALRGLEQRDQTEAAIDLRDPLGRLGLGDHHGAIVGLREGPDVGIELSRADGIHPHDDPRGVEIRFDERAASGPLVGRSDRVFEVEDDGIRAIERLAEPLGAVGGAEEDRGSEVEGHAGPSGAS